MTNLRDRVQDFDEQVSGSTEEMDVDELEAELGINFEDAYINNYLPEVSKRFKPQDIADEAVTPTVDQDDLESTEEKNSDELKAELRIDCEQDANVKAPLPEEPESPEPQDKAEEAATPAAVEKDDLESPLQEDIFSNLLSRAWGHTLQERASKNCPLHKTLHYLPLRSSKHRRTNPGMLRTLS